MKWKINNERTYHEFIDRYTDHCRINKSDIFIDDLNRYHNNNKNDIESDLDLIVYMEYQYLRKQIRYMFLFKDIKFIKYNSKDRKTCTLSGILNWSYMGHKALHYIKYGEV